MKDGWVRFDFGIIGIVVGGSEYCFEPGDVAYLPGAAIETVLRTSQVTGSPIAVRLTRKEGEQEYRARHDELPDDYLDDWLRTFYRASEPGPADFEIVPELAREAADRWRAKAAGPRKRYHGVAKYGSGDV